MSGKKCLTDLARRLGVSEDDIKMYLEAFNMLDENKDGLISPLELYNAFKRVGCHTSYDHAMRMVQMADENGDGMVDINEYLSMILHSHIRLSPDGEEECWMTFKMFDNDKDGYISLEELRGTMSRLNQSLTDEEATAMFQVMDANQDGKISYTEFITSWMQWLVNADKSN